MSNGMKEYECTVYLFGLYQAHCRYDVIKGILCMNNSPTRNVDRDLICYTYLSFLPTLMQCSINGTKEIISLPAFNTPHPGILGNLADLEE